MEIKLYYRFFSVSFQDSFATRRIHAACPIIRNLIQIVNKFKLKKYSYIWHAFEERPASVF